MTTFLDSPDAAKDARFVTEYIRTGDKIAAAATAGVLDPMYAAEDIANMMLARPEISVAIQAARAALSTRIKGGLVTRETATADAEDIMQAALNDGKYAPAVSALRLKAELNSLLEQKIEITHTMKIEDLDTATLMKLVNAKARPKQIEGTAEEVDE
jgi:phage terminase small subunit